MFPQRQQIPGFGAVAEALFRCIPRHGACERHCHFVPFPQWHRIPRFTAVAAFLLFRFPSCGGTFPSSHHPKVRRFPAFSSHLPNVCNRPGSSVAPVSAFPFPAAFSHLPKVRGISVFLSHLPEVRNRPWTICRACTRVSVSSCLFPPSEGARNSRVSASPSGGAHWNGMPDHRLYV